MKHFSSSAAGSAVTFADGCLFLNGEPAFLLSGELHYFRQSRENWQHLIDEAKAMGLNCVASYVPWLLHEEKEGEYDFSGNLDLGAFIDLCGQNGLYVFIRPGPFIMAEMKNEGLPYWIAEKHPDALPVGFGGARPATSTLDYLHPGYLADCKKWYNRVMREIAPRLYPNGGPIIGVQLDNEVGMLSWVTNTPLLNENALLRFGTWLKEQYPQETLAARYPFSPDDKEALVKGCRFPEDPYSPAFHRDFGRFMRGYYAEYLRILRGYAEEEGIQDVPFFVNVHGTGDTRLFDYPLGLSQLYEGWNGGDMISGGDLYLGEPREGTYQDLYLGNALTACMNKNGSPLTTIEFECSDGPYCSLNDMRFHPAAIPHNTLMTVMQGAKMANYYVFSGGENTLLRRPPHDGDDRMAFTGQCHGYNAPVGPDGSHNDAFPLIARMAKVLDGAGDFLADAFPAADPVALGFVPDLFLTELCCPSSGAEKAIQQNLKRWRCAGLPADSLARALLDNQVIFTAADIQNGPIPADKVLVFFSPRYLPGAIQQKLVDFVKQGGTLLLYGELPEYDLEGNPCAILLDALSLPKPQYRQNAQPRSFLTVSVCGALAGSAADNRANFAQCFPQMPEGILSPYGTELCCGFIRPLGQGKVAAVTCDYPNDPAFYRQLFKELGLKGALQTPHPRRGIFASRLQGKKGGELLCLLNLDYTDKTLPVILNGQKLFDSLTLEAKAGVLLPLNFPVAGAVICLSDAELVASTADSLTLRTTQQGRGRLVIAGREPLPAENVKVTAAKEGFLTEISGGEVTIHLR